MKMSKKEAEEVLRSSEHKNEEKIKILEDGGWKLIEIVDLCLCMEEK